MPRPPDAADLSATRFVDHDDPAVREFAHDVTAGATDDHERVAALFAAVRDAIRYDPWTVDLRPEAMRASTVLRAERDWCVPKATLLAATARAVGVPARLGFADVRNHLSTERLQAAMGTDVFRWHGYTLLWVAGAWRKASPAFNAELCHRFGVPPLAFDGRSDALLHAHDGEGRQYMEYVVDRGDHADLPLDVIAADLRETYPDLVAQAGRPHDDPGFR